MSWSADEVIETFESAAEENRLSSLRREQVVHLPATGEVWVTGDLHDHRTNFNKITKAANLAENPNRHLILHELIHGDHVDENGAEDSWQTLLRAAEMKAVHSTQLHFLLANHDLAQIHGEGISKSGMSVCEAFTRALKRDFGTHSGAVNVALSDFLLSMPLAARTGTGLFFCHSLPRDEQMEAFDFTIFDRPLTGADYTRRIGPVYQLIWGRNMAPESVVKFADKVGAKILVTGHQPQDRGWSTNGSRHLIIASDHNQGVYLPLDLAVEYDMLALTQRLKKFVALDV